MLNIDRLLQLARSAQVEPGPIDPARPDHEKSKLGQQNLGATKAIPTDPTDPSKKTAVETIQGAGAASAVPAYIRAVLELGGYEDYFPVWTPEVCREFLEVLTVEWSGFHINGWNGLTMPDTWPPAFMDAVQSVYVLALQGWKD